MRLDLPESKEWPLGQLLTSERETLGFYLSGHPFDPHREEVRELVGCDLGALERSSRRNNVAPVGAAAMAKTRLAS